MDNILNNTKITQLHDNKNTENNNNILESDDIQVNNNNNNNDNNDNNNNDNNDNDNSNNNNNVLKLNDKVNSKNTKNPTEIKNKENNKVLTNKLILKKRNSTKEENKNNYEYNTSVDVFSGYKEIVKEKMEEIEERGEDAREILKKTLGLYSTVDYKRIEKMEQLRKTLHTTYLKVDECVSRHFKKNDYNEYKKQRMGIEAVQEQDSLDLVIHYATCINKNIALLEKKLIDENPTRQEKTSWFM